MEYMSAREAADKWGISQRRVAVLCSENRIENATMIGNMWIIPTSAEKPIDAKVSSLKRLNVTIRLIVEKLQNTLNHLLAAVQFCLIYLENMI